MGKAVVVMGVILVVLLAIYLFVPANKPQVKISNPSSVKSEAIEKAKQLYNQQKLEGISMENGPCLTEEIISDWAVDVAHDPRLEIDNQPENQCRSFREGKTHHFVELDPEGNFIRAL